MRCFTMLLLAAAALAHNACTSAKGNAATGEWAYNSLGGDFNGMIDSSGMVGEVDNSTSFVEAARLTGKVIGYIELGKTVRSVASDARAAYETNRDLKLDRAKVDSREAVQLRELDVKENIATETIAAEAEAVAP